MRQLILAVFAFLPLFAEDAPAAPATANTYLAQAKDLLGKGKATLTGADAEKLDKAIATLDLLMVKPVENADKLDLKILRSIINARFIAKGAANDDLTISYTTWDSTALSDWVVTGSNPTIVKGALAVEPGASFTNKIQLKSATVAGEVMCANKEGKHLGSTGGFGVLVDSYNAWLVHLQVSGTTVGTATFDKAYTQTDGSGTWIPFSFKLDKNEASLTWKGQKLAGQMNADFGSLILSGGTGGNQFRGITLAGTVDHEWVKAAAQQKALDEITAKKKK